MAVFKCSEVIKAVGGNLVSGDANVIFSGISIDSRKIGNGELFIPIEGKNFDGHDYIEKALKNGASGALTKHSDVNYHNYSDKCIINVENTLKALGDIAKYHRSRFNTKVVAITGSVGKTSTKDMISKVLEEQYKVLSTQGNFNNEIGLPLTLLNLQKDHDIAVIEMGMRGFGEIELLSKIAKPDTAVITNIGSSHIEKLGSRNNILKAKMEIIHGMESSGTLILNGDDNLLLSLKDLVGMKTIYYGLEENLKYQAYNVKTGENGSMFYVMLGNKEYEIKLSVPGIHNVYNALAAISTGMEYGMDPELILSGLAKYKSSYMRMNIINNGVNNIIDDTYNSSPDSVKAALSVLCELSAKRKIAILGDMLELGEFSEKAHYQAGIEAVKAGTDFIIAIGQFAQNTVKGALQHGISKKNVLVLDNNDDACKFLETYLKIGDALLIKGSRGMGMESIVSYFKRDEVY